MSKVQSKILGGAIFKMKKVFIKIPDDALNSILEQTKNGAIVYIPESIKILNVDTYTGEVNEY
jgi:hypothetical protein